MKSVTIITLFPLFLNTTIISAFIHPVDDETYKVLLKLCKNDFAVPVATRTNFEKAAVVKFWRAKGKFQNIDNVLYYDGRKVKKWHYIFFFFVLCIFCDICSLTK